MGLGWVSGAVGSEFSGLLGVDFAGLGWVFQGVLGGFQGVRDGFQIWRWGWEFRWCWVVVGGGGFSVWVVGGGWWVDCKGFGVGFSGGVGCGIGGGGLGGVGLLLVGVGFRYGWLVVGGLQGAWGVGVALGVGVSVVFGCCWWGWDFGMGGWWWVYCKGFKGWVCGGVKVVTGGGIKWCWVVEFG
ncbi:unnamed protein product [Ilex paraguariensis]|uniref:Uncharacterized protein n=1 Tax=Ilex paraguariensis TaxID=185542 RepID=A0ABC8TRQ5_9AQUA